MGDQCHGSAGESGEAPRPKRKGPQVAEVFRVHGREYLKRHRVSPEQYRAIRDITLCRTAALGGNRRTCPMCGYTEVHYSSCCNRHCPTCHWMARTTWTVQRKERVLPVDHFFVTFTVPEELRGIALQNQTEVYSLAFRASNQTLDVLAREDLGQLGVTTVLHTWSRKLSYHPHLHSLVTAGGLDGETWTSTKPDFLFPVARMRALFRKNMLQGLHRLYDQNELAFRGTQESLGDPGEFGVLVKRLWNKQWVVDVQAPRGRPEHAIKYLAAYTHRVAISDHRMVSLTDGRVTFRTRGTNTLTLDHDEFIRRFLLHVLPNGFHKIRHYGLYSNSSKARLETARQLVPTSPSSVPSEAEPDPKTGHLEAKTWEDTLTDLTGIDPRRCPRCGHQGMIVTRLDRGPPEATPRDPEDTS